jgi:hypothetical protein
MPSDPESWEEERKEDDLEDLEPDNSGGELGVLQTVVVISSGVRSDRAANRGRWEGVK